MTLALALGLGLGLELGLGALTGGRVRGEEGAVLAVQLMWEEQEEGAEGKGRGKRGAGRPPSCT